MDNNLSLRVLTCPDSLRQLSGEWAELCSRCPASTPFQRPEWLLPWIQAFHTRDLYVLEARDQQRLVGLAPLFLYKRPGDTILAPLGAGITDYLDWIIDPALESQVLRGFLDFLQHSDAGWDRLEMTDLPAGSALVRSGLPAQHCRQSNACPVLFIAPGAKCLTDVVPAKKRRNLINARNRARREGNVSIEIAGEAQLNELLDAMLRLHTTRWNESGKPGVLADPAVQEFHRLAAPLLLRSGVLRFYGLRFERKLIATLYALVDPQIAYCYLQGFDPRYRELSPGAQLLGAVIEDAIRDGKRAVDFLRGQEPYKYSWGARDEFTYTLQFGRRVVNSSPTMTETAA